MANETDRFTLMRECIESLTDRIGIYVDMKPADLRAIFMAAGMEAREDLVICINELNDQLSGIADELEKSLKPGREALAKIRRT